PADRKAFRYVSWTRSSASAGRRVSRIAVPYKLSTYDSASRENASSALIFDASPAGADSPRGGTDEVGRRRNTMASLQDAQSGKTPMGPPFIPCIVSSFRLRPSSEVPGTFPRKCQAPFLACASIPPRVRGPDRPSSPKGGWHLSAKVPATFSGLVRCPRMVTTVHRG